MEDTFRPKHVYRYEAAVQFSCVFTQAFQMQQIYRLARITLPVFAVLLSLHGRLAPTIPDQFRNGYKNGKDVAE